MKRVRSLYVFPHIKPKPTVPTRSPFYVSFISIQLLAVMQHIIPQVKSGKEIKLPQTF
jgi:hypothetical protein